MADIFQVEAARWNGRESFAAELELPLTPYGFVVRRDGQPIQTREHDAPQMGGMEVTM